MITDRFPAERWHGALETTRAARSGKVVIDWS